MRAFGFSSGLAVKVGNEDPGPQRMIAWKPGAGIERAWGILRPVTADALTLEALDFDSSKMF